MFLQSEQYGINPKTLVIVILFMGGSPIIGADNIFAQDDSGTGTIVNGTKTFEDLAVDMTFQYPAHWNLRQIDPYFLTISLGNDSVVHVSVEPLDLLDPPIVTLKDFARHQYDTLILGTPNLINDNQTTVAGNNPALQMEYSFEGTADGVQRHGLVVWTIDNDRNKGYEFNYFTNEGPEFFENLPAVREMLSSIEFRPLSPPQEEPPVKEPSFMN
jgi:hypothetical protein